MDEKTYYHEMLSNGLTKLKEINLQLQPVLEEYMELHSKGIVPCDVLSKLSEPIKNLEKEIVVINKLLRDIQEDCKDYYEGLK
ncbi:MAG TPA: hypothetical protein PK397_05870 [Ignavibacteriaceae bacterium]|jgi:hypothetical protein|nr:hypothetical protein [Ignavibacteriaceae bacterium]